MLYSVEIIRLDKRSGSHEEKLGNLNSLRSCNQTKLYHIIHKFVIFQNVIRRKFNTLIVL